MQKDFFSIMKHKNLKESVLNFDNNALIKNIKKQEDNTHFHIENFPGAFGNMQNKNNRVYDQNSLTYATNWFNEIKDSNPYFCYIFDGHKDDDSYENIVGRILQLKIDQRNKCILMDLKLNKGSKVWPILKNIIIDGDPIGASMRIITPNIITLSKDELKKINNNIIFLEDDNRQISSLLSNNNEIEFITGEAYIQRFDITQFPSFNYSFVEDPFLLDPRFNKKESVKDLSKTATQFVRNDNCITNSCTFRKQIKSFVDLINIDDSINLTKDENLYNSMIEFSYINLDQFDFNSIKNPNYLKQELIDNNYTNINEYKNIISNILHDNIINYIIENDTFNYNLFNKLLLNTINKIVDENNIMYQLITLNYLHFIILSTLLLSNKEKNEISDMKKLLNIININIEKNSDNESFIFDFIKNVKNDNNSYNYINEFFSYLYSYIGEYGEKIAPITIINEAIKKFKCKSLINLNYIN